LVGAVLELLAFGRNRSAWTICPARAGPAAGSRAESGTSLGFILWALITGVVMSLAFVPHATYLAVVALPLAALAVAAAARVARLYRVTRAWPSLPALVTVQTLWGASIAVLASPSLRWLAPLILSVGLASSAALVVIRRRTGAPSWMTRTALIAALSAALVGPVVWSLCVLGPGGGGSASDGFAGPRMSSMENPAHSGIAAAAGSRVRSPRPVPRVHGLDAAQQRLLGYVNARNRHGSIPFAADTMAIVVSVILYTKLAPIPMGGFSQHAPTPGVSQFRQYIESGSLRFVLLADYGPATQPPDNPVVSRDRLWVEAHCVPALSGRFRQGKSARQTLYDCAVPGRP
jgi:hypothetical protein